MPRIPVRIHRFRGDHGDHPGFSGMWTDGRYFVQAKKELEGQDTRLMAMGEEGVPTIEEYLMDHMPEGGVLGFDGRVVNAAQGRKFETMMQRNMPHFPSAMTLRVRSGKNARSFRHRRCGSST